MKAWAPLVPPLVFPLLLVIALASCPDAAGWSGNPLVVYLPFLLLTAAFILGGIFAQSRISFVSAMLMSVTHLVNRSFFERPDPAKGLTVILLAAIYVPPFTALLYHLRERGMFTFHGYTRMVLVLSALIVIFIFPEIRALDDAVFASKSALLKPVGPLCRVPAAGFLMFLVCAPAFLIRNKHESPMLGRILLAAMLFTLGALNFQASLWKPECGQTAFLAFMSAAALSLLWAALESAWRNALIDELTELPGRRALKQRLARLSDQFVIAVLDIDYFKKINDKHGHDTGDQVLRFIAAQLREKDIGNSYRYGGEEFVIVCEEDLSDKKLAAIESLRKGIEDRKFWIRGKNRPRKKPDIPPQAPKAEKPKSVTITVSIGVATNNERRPTPNEVLEAADKALYRAKESGRNCVKIAR